MICMLRLAIWVDRIEMSVKYTGPAAYVLKAPLHSVRALGAGAACPCRRADTASEWPGGHADRCAPLDSHAAQSGSGGPPPT